MRRIAIFVAAVTLAGACNDGGGDSAPRPAPLERPTVVTTPAPAVSTLLPEQAPRGGDMEGGGPYEL